jgi:DNA repair exonuclease SbcCD ATPase subunit
LSKLDEALCPTCGSEIKDKDELLSDLKSEKRKLEARHQEYSERLLQLKRMKEVADRLVDYESKLSSLPKGDPESLKSDISKYTDLSQRLKAQIRSADLRSELERQLEDLPQVESSGDPDEIKVRLNSLRKSQDRYKTLQRLQSILDGLPTKSPNDKHLQKLESRLKETKEEITKVSLESQRLKKERSEWKHLNQRLSEVQKSVSRARKYRIEEAALSGLKSAFSRNGLRMLSLRRVLRAITESLPKYINLLFDGNNFKVKMAEDTFDFKVYSSKVEIPRQMLSKGERARLALALLLATRKAMPVRKLSNILIIDEVLDGLDLQGVGSVMKTFEYLRAHEKISSIFLISPMAKLFRKKRYFDQKWIVTKSNNESTISM